MEWIPLWGNGEPAGTGDEAGHGLWMRYYCMYGNVQILITVFWLCRRMLFLGIIHRVLEKVRAGLEETGKLSNKDLFEKTPSLQNEPKEEVKTRNVRGQEHGAY